MALSRSISKATILNHCTKKYYFSTYSNYLREVDEWLWSEAMLAKNLKSIQMRFGEKVHDLMSDYLRLIQNWTENEENINKIKRDLIDEIDNKYYFSKNREYVNYDFNHKFWLTEHYYKKNIDDVFEKGKLILIETFDNFIKSDFNKEIKSLFNDSSNTFFIEPKQKDFESMKIKIDNIPELMWIDIYAQPDFWIIKKTWEYIIYDRKSGKTPNKEKDKISDQLKVYAYKLLQKVWIEKINDIKIQWFEIYLKSLKKFGGTIWKNQIQEIENKIILDTKKQTNLLIDKNIETNNPLSSENFPRTNDLQKCSNCTFFKVCEKLKTKESQK